MAPQEGHPRSRVKMKASFIVGRVGHIDMDRIKGVIAAANNWGLSGKSVRKIRVQEGKAGKSEGENRIEIELET
jgi:hypothetical protein